MQVGLISLLCTGLARAMVRIEASAMARVISSAFFNGKMNNIFLCTLVLIRGRNGGKKQQTKHYFNMQSALIPSLLPHFIQREWEREREWLVVCALWTPLMQCGMVLGALLLVACAILTQWTCKMLMRASVMTRNHSYEDLGMFLWVRWRDRGSSVEFNLVLNGVLSSAALSVLGNMGKYFTGVR